MSWKNAIRIGSLTGATAVAFFTAIIIPRFNVESPPLYDELLCWLLVLAVVGCPWGAIPRFWKSRGISSSTPLARLYWIAASSITVTAVSSSLFDTIWITPVVAYAFLARRPSSRLTRLHALVSEHIPYPWFAFAVGMGILVSVAPILDATRLVASTLAAVGLAGTYFSMIRISGQDDDFIDGWEDLGTQKFVRSLAPRVQYLMALSSLCVTSMWPGRMPDWTGVALAGGWKTAHWISILWLTQEMPWEMALMIRAYVAASIGSYNAPASGLLGLLQTSARVAIAFLSLHETVDFLPTAEKGRALLAVFALWPAISLVRYILLGDYKMLLFGSNGPQ